MKKIFLLLVFIAGTISATKNKNKNKSSKPASPAKYLGVKEEISSAIITLPTSYLLYRGLNKLNYLPASWDPLPILGSLIAGVAGVGLLYYSYCNSHRCYAILHKEDYVEWDKENTLAEARDQQEKELAFGIKQSKQAQTSYEALYKIWRDVPRIKDWVGKGAAIDRCFNRAFYPLLVGTLLAGMSVVANPVGFKASNALFPNVHPWAVGMLSVGLNMLMIKSGWALICPKG